MVLGDKIRVPAEAQGEAVRKLESFCLFDSSYQQFLFETQNTEVQINVSHPFKGN